MNERDSVIRAFAENAGWGAAEIAPIPGDASFRRYFRLIEADRRAILMDAPPPEEDPRPFLDVARYLTAQGLRAPEILAADAATGLVLLEDFGDVRMRETVDASDADTERAIYARALETLAHLHDRPAAIVPLYDRAVYQREVGLLTEWYCPARGLDIDADGYVRAWDKVLDAMDPSAPHVTVLRDYHAENIMLLDNGGQGLLDFQDALVGDPAYDLVSLLQDARRDVSPALEAEMIEAYRALANPAYDFDTAYHVLGAQRNAKIVGIFVRLWKRDGKPRYPLMIPRVWAAMERDLKHPALSPVAAWFDANIPAELRDPAGTLGGEFAL
ncbi:aminoglycoside phosphotransferase family protein [Blastomonas aquatica]|uniref:Aminoglycoside phosphotransferase n=1 Tax=Blastomonas aquatica TaxID=1510276 RepID=A0ABQ1JDX7_9SPHN|nr:phosphotransferase [Blastomonas aquatica]GGB66461.1 aminoglycoside phosphotransferase [Blastomonas aquatica]